MTRNRYSLPDGEGVQTKPLIFGASAYDTDRLDDLEFSGERFDGSYVPGYSELRTENELAVKDGRKPVPLPRLQWVRIKKPDGATYVPSTDEGMVEWVRLGYRACGVDDLKKYGYGWPPAAGHGPNPDGLICRGGDVALFIVDEERAERNRRAREKELGSESAPDIDTQNRNLVLLDQERKDYTGSEIQRAIQSEVPEL